MSETDYCEVNCGELHQPGCSHYVIQEVEKQRDLIELCGKLQVERDQLREEVKWWKEKANGSLDMATKALDERDALKQKADALAEALEKIGNHPRDAEIATAALAVFRGEKRQSIVIAKCAKDRQKRLKSSAVMYGIGFYFRRSK